MDCKHIGICGSCTLGHYNYNDQLNLKIKKEKNRFEDIWTDNFKIIKSKKSNFRNRMEFRIFHTKNNIFYAMHDINKKLFIVNSCDIVSIGIFNIMKPLLEKIISKTVLFQKIFSIEFLCSLDEKLVTTMIYHKKLDIAWEKEARKLQDELNIKIIGRSKKQKIILDDDIIIDDIKTKKFQYKIRYQEGNFTQPNQHINISMIDWVINNTISKDDICELYCGVGNFTIPLSKIFNKVLSTEISKKSIRNAEINCEINNISNVKVARMSSEEFSQAILGIREFKRLKFKNIFLKDYSFSTIFVDPPRSGLDETTINLSKKFWQIVYISCNPETLHKNLLELLNTHEIKHFAFFDQFAFSNHIECGVVLHKKILNKN